MKTALRPPVLAHVWISALLLGFIAVPAGAQEAEKHTGLIDNFGKWSAFAEPADAGKKTLCYMASVPEKEEGKYSSRGDTLVIVTHRPKDKTFNVVSIKAGYVHQEGSEVTVTIGGGTFTLFTDSGYAWAAEPRIDRQLVAAMKAGRTMVVQGMSGRGTKTTDTYSLAGVTAAHKAIGKACNVK